VTGFVFFTVKGLNLEKLLNSLAKEGLFVYGCRRGYRELTFRTVSNDSAKVVAILSERCYDYSVSSGKSVVSAAKFFVKRSGLIAAAALFILAVIIPGFITADIEIYGLETYGSGEITAFLAQNGIGTGFKRHNKDAVNKAVTAGFSGIAFCASYYSGTVLIINVVEAEKMPAVMSKEPQDVLSPADGVLLRLIVYNGTALCKAGDAVQKGQVLIGGFRLTPGGDQVPVRALGEAYAEIELSYTVEFYSVRQELARTGNSVTEAYVLVFGGQYPKQRNENKYKNFETEYSESFVTYNNFLPLSQKTVTYYELEEVTVREDFEKIKRALVSDAEEKATADALKTGRILSCKTDIINEGNCKKIVTKIKVEVRLV